jgi:hypothetical protein
VLRWGAQFCKSRRKCRVRRIAAGGGDHYLSVHSVVDASMRARDVNVDEMTLVVYETCLWGSALLFVIFDYV